MFCPDCGAEFREGIARCNDCGVALVEGGPAPEPTAEFRELAVVGRYLHPAAAAAVQCALRGAGFRCWLLNEHMVSLYWIIAPALGGICVVVDAEDGEAAGAWLKDAVVDSPPLPADEYLPLRSSPKRRMATVLTYVALLPDFAWALIIALIIYTDRSRQTDLERLEEVFD